jgi:hypothetical protein
MKMGYFQKLKEPQLVELEGEMEFVLVTEIDISEMRNGIIIMKGQSYNYENGELEKRHIKEIQYSTTEDGYHDLDENGNMIE